MLTSIPENKEGPFETLPMTPTSMDQDISYITVFSLWLFLLSARHFQTPLQDSVIYSLGQESRNPTPPPSIIGIINIFTSIFSIFLLAFCILIYIYHFLLNRSVKITKNKPANKNVGKFGDPCPRANDSEVFVQKKLSN